MVRKMDAKTIKKLIQLKDVDKIIAWLKEDGWTEAKHTEYLGRVSMVDVFNADEVVCSPNVRLPNSEYLCACVYDNVSTAKDWLWMVIDHEKKFGLGRIPKALYFYVKKKI